MDDCLDNFHRLTVRSRLHNFWHRCILYVTGARYALKLLHFTHRNVLVLRHFQRCREIEAAVTQSKKTRFPYLDFYKRTWQQSRKLFTSIRTATPPVPSTSTSNQRQSQPTRYAIDIEKELSAFARSCEPASDWTAALTRASVYASTQQVQQDSTLASDEEGIFEDEGDVAIQTTSNAKVGRNRLLQPDFSLLQSQDVLAPHSCNHHTHSTSPMQRKPPRVRTALRRGVLVVWHAPYFFLRKLGMFFRTRIFKVKLRHLYQRQQIELLRERQRIITTTQTAFFLSLANTIDLHTTRELAILCQHVSRARRKRKLTEEDRACFDQSITELDNNHETLRHAA